MIVGARSFHPGGVNLAMADGSVHFMNEGIKTTVWQALGSINSGEVISSSDY